MGLQYKGSSIVLIRDPLVLMLKQKVASPASFPSPTLSRGVPSSTLVLPSLVSCNLLLCKRMDRESERLPFCPRVCNCWRLEPLPPIQEQI